MRGREILLLLGLVRHGFEPDWKVRSLADEVQLPPATVQRTLAKLGETPAYDAGRRRVNWSATTDLLVYALPFVVPVRLGEPTRGIPTAWAVAPLANEIGEAGDLPPVWPSAEGEVRGRALQPLDAAAITLAGSNPWMYEMLAVVDGVRVGDARVRGLAREILRERLAECERA